MLVVAGAFKRAEPDLAEDALLMRALRDFNIPKIVREDEVVFFGLLGEDTKTDLTQDGKLEKCSNLTRLFQVLGECGGQACMGLPTVSPNYIFCVCHRLTLL